MHVLQQYVERFEGLSSFVKSAAENPLTQAIILDINPIWLRSYDLFHAGLDPRFYESGPFPGGRWWQDEALMLRTDAVDLSWTNSPEWVRYYCRELFGKDIPETLLPFLVKVVVRPIAGPDDLERRYSMARHILSQPLPALIETRPAGNLCLAPGDSIRTGAAKSGTIGGFLKDDKSNIYAATCGHVVNAGDTVTINGKSIGKCSFSFAPVSMQPGQICVQYCAHANNFDMALIGVNAPQAVSNTVTGIARQIWCRQSIACRTSKVSAYEVGGLALTYSVGNSNVCFENIFEVRPVLNRNLNPKVAFAAVSVPVPGDSGAWVETASGSDWCGVLVAADGIMGYALCADSMLAEAQKRFGIDLQLV
jgi:hypothetical protein